MKITVFVPGDDHLATAGVRIRYQRLKRRLQAAGHIFELVTINSFQFEPESGFDTYIFCKCHDARSLILADAMARAGARIGVDLFDDYFSQSRDSRFVHRREWLRKIASSLTFALCSTERMRANVAAFLPNLPSHIINDPFDEIDQEHVSTVIERNVERALSTRHLDVGWFGMGDNRYFPVGLSDLSAFGGILVQSRRLGFEPRLSILTNRRALTAERLEMLARLAVPYILEEWTEDLERHLIANSLLCFLPVNAQPFSVVKSLNRAVTTLVGGSQVLSTGYPLYAELGPFVYRDISTLLTDVERRAPALRRSTVSDLREHLASTGDPESEASNLISFLEHLPAVDRRAAAPDKDFQAVVHGVEALRIVHKFAQEHGTLSVASPLSSANLDFDVRIQFDLSTGSAFAILSETVYQRLPYTIRRRCQPYQTAGKENLRQILLPKSLGWEAEDLLLDANVFSPSATLSAYTTAIERTLATLRTLFGDIRVHLSETKSPYIRRTTGTPSATDTTSLSDMDAA